MLLCQSRLPGKGSSSIAQKIRMKFPSRRQIIRCDKGFIAFLISADRRQAVRQEAVQIKVIVKQVVEVLKEGPRIDVAAAEFKLNKVDASLPEHSARSLERRQLMPF